MDRTFSEVEVATMMEMILKGLVLMHSENLMHRDIKGANILISGDGYAKLGDFGVGAALSDEKYRISKKGSPYWMSPQVASSVKYDFKTDIWSLGITCVELLEGEPPFSDLKPKNVMERISKKPPSANEIIDLNEHTSEFKSFLEHCLEKDPKKRSSAKELLKHEFIIKFSKGRKYMEKLVKKHQQDVERFRIESEEEYQKLMKKNELNKNKEICDEDSNNINENNNNDDIYSYDVNDFYEIKNLNSNVTYQENINIDNLDSIDNKMQKFLNNNKRPEEKEKKLNFEKEKNNSLLVCYTESINTIGDKSSISKEKENIIVLDKNIKKKNIKKNKDEELMSHIIQLMKTNDKNNNTNINDKLNLTGSYIKSSTSSNSRRDYVDKKDINDNFINENMSEEIPETKREKKPKRFSYNSNNISYINDKYKIYEENIEDDDDEGLIRQSNESINFFLGINSYKSKRESNRTNINNIKYK
jgi:hypothetical protein